jgi:hypothetical protein
MSSESANDVSMKHVHLHGFISLHEGRTSLKDLNELKKNMHTYWPDKSNTENNIFSTRQDQISCMLFATSSSNLFRQLVSVFLSRGQSGRSVKLILASSRDLSAWNFTPTIPHVSMARFLSIGSTHFLFLWLFFHMNYYTWENERLQSKGKM